MTGLRRLAGVGMLALAPAVLLAGCSKSSPEGGNAANPDTGPKTIEQVQKEASKIDRPKPGRYEQIVEIKSVEMPGAPKELAEQMKKALTKTAPSTYCLTQEQADKGWRDMFREGGPAKSCTYKRFDVSGGRIDAQMECSTNGEGKATMTMSGTVGPTGSEVNMDMASSGGQGPMSGLNMKMHMKTTRVGDCN